MATTTVAAAGTALALYYYSRRQCNPSDPNAAETHTGAHSAPKSFLEDLYFFAEGLRYTYGETFGRWRTADLLIGLAYLSKKETNEHPVADIARHGNVFALGLEGGERAVAMEKLQLIERVFRYCSGLRERRPIFQRRYIVEFLKIPEEDIIRQEVRAGVLKPSYVITKDASLGAIVLAIRGTHSFKDAFTSLTGASKPHHVVDSNGVVLGYSHFGMLAAARWLKGEVGSVLVDTLEAHRDYKLYIIGHSLGGGTAAMLTMMLREQGGIFSEAQCIAVACPACMTLELAKSCAGYVTTVINSADVIPTISPGSADTLREEVMHSSWIRDFRQDMRASYIVRAVEKGIRGVGSATVTATSWTATRLTACYQRQPHGQQLKRRNSDDNLRAEGASRSRGGPTEGGGGPQRKYDSDSDLPLSTSPPESSTSMLQQEASGSADWTSFSRISTIAAEVTSFTGRQAQSLGRSVTQTASRLASSPSTLLRTWSMGPGVEGVFSSRQDDRQLEVEMELESESGVAVEGSDTGDAVNGDIGVGVGVTVDAMVDDEVDGLDIDSDEESLRAEANIRLREVERAVSAAEDEERVGAPLDGGHAVPAVIRPGSYGLDGSPRGSNRPGDLSWRRMMYPAGRIMHLVPARLVPDLDWDLDDNSVNVDAVNVNQEWPEATMEDEIEIPVAVSNTTLEHANRHSRHMSELSLKDLVSSEEAAGSAAAGGGPTNGPLPKLKPAPGPPPEPMVLLDGVPQESYGRIRLCRTVLSDHVIPNYLRSLRTFVDRFPSRVD